MVNEECGKIPVWHCQILSNELRKYIIGFKNNVMLNVQNYLDQYVHSKGTVNIYGISTISSKGCGVINFSYSPSSTKYLLNNQFVRLYSDNRLLQATIVIDDSIKNIDINGMVNKATISEMSLFPSFFGWYRDNIYLTPITLLTTVFGGVTLMLNNKRKAKYTTDYL